MVALGAESNRLKHKSRLQGHCSVSTQTTSNGVKRLWFLPRRSSPSCSFCTHGQSRQRVGHPRSIKAVSPKHQLSPSRQELRHTPHLTERTSEEKVSLGDGQSKEKGAGFNDLSAIPLPLPVLPPSLTSASKPLSASKLCWLSFCFVYSHFSLGFSSAYKHQISSFWRNYFLPFCSLCLL